MLFRNQDSWHIFVLYRLIHSEPIKFFEIKQKNKIESKKKNRNEVK